MKSTPGAGGIVLLSLLALHVALGLVRLPHKVCAQRWAHVAAYREHGAARTLLGDARLAGAAEFEWLLANVDEHAAVLWRWPADGALEFVAALLAPRLVVDERTVPAGATTFAGRPLARATLPDGASGVVVVQGTAAGGLALRVRE